MFQPLEEMRAQCSWLGLPDQAGSMYTGKCVLADVRSVWSGVRVSPLAVVVTCTWATWLPAVGPGASSAPAALRVVVAVPVLVAAESHMVAVSLWKTAVPDASWAIAPPSALAASVSPDELTGSVRLRSAGLAAAVASCTTSNSLKPPASAVSCRSTPGRTFAYFAVEPERVGAGSVAGNVNDKVFVPCDSVAIAPLPPLENATPVTVAAGRMVPSACTARVVSVGAQAPFLLARPGAAFCVCVKA